MWYREKPKKVEMSLVMRVNAPRSGALLVRDMQSASFHRVHGGRHTREDPKVIQSFAFPLVRAFPLLASSIPPKG